jgi:hypothetical protein
VFNQRFEQIREVLGAFTAVNEREKKMIEKYHDNPSTPSETITER